MGKTIKELGKELVEDVESGLKIHVMDRKTFCNLYPIGEFDKEYQSLKANQMSNTGNISIEKLEEKLIEAKELGLNVRISNSYTSINFYPIGEFDKDIEVNQNISNEELYEKVDKRIKEYREYLESQEINQEATTLIKKIFKN